MELLQHHLEKYVWQVKDHECLNMSYSILIFHWQLGCVQNSGFSFRSSEASLSTGFKFCCWEVQGHSDNYLSICDLVFIFRVLWKFLSVPNTVVVVKSPSCVWLFVTPWTAELQASLSLTISQSLPKFMSIASVMQSSHLILWCPLLLLPSIFPSIRDFSNEPSVHIRWPKYWSFSFSVSPSSEYSRLISLKIDWFDLLALQGTFRSLLQHHSSKASILWCSAFFTVQLAQPYVTTGKTTALTIRTFVSRVTSLLFNTLSRFVMAFLPRSNHLLISWLQSTICSDFGAQEEEICHYFPLFPFYLPWNNGARCHDLSFLICSLKLTLLLSSLILIKRLFSSSSLSAFRVSSTYLRLLMFLLPILIPACNSSRPAFLMMCSALNKQGDSPVILLSQSWTNQFFHTGF